MNCRGFPKIIPKKVHKNRSEMYKQFIKMTAWKPIPLGLGGNADPPV